MAKSINAGSDALPKRIGAFGSLLLVLTIIGFTPQESVAVAMAASAYLAILARR